VPTIIDRLLGREPPTKAVVEQKAVVTGNGGTGPGVLAWMNDVPLWAASRNPRRLMKQAQELYHRDLIVRAAEHRVSAAAAGLPWHLEDENEDEVTDESAPELVEIRDWLEKPQGALETGRKMTRRALWQITSRHAGLCGSAFWFLDQRRLVSGTPLATLYINPARMYPAQNDQGFLRGWKLDADEDGNGGVPLELDEVLQFDFEPPDFGHYGIGLVESAWAVAGLTRSLEQHETTLFTAGARLAGLISPKVGVTLSDDQWDAAVRDWRRITSDPDSAKRLHILRGPVDYTRTGATMQELAVEHIAKMAREDKLALWGVPLSQLPLPVAAGMNSGETKAFDEAVFFQGAVHDRVLILSEVIQTQVLDRIAENGGPSLQLVIEEPEFDDTTPLFDRAQKAIDQPLTVNERRALLNMDPLPDIDIKNEPLGSAIWLPSKLSLAMAGPDEKGNLIALPEPEPPPAALPPPTEEEPELVAAKATLGGLRKRVDSRFVRALQKDVQAALKEQAAAIAKRVRSRGEAVRKSKGAWWDQKAEDARLRRVIERHNLAVAQLVVEEVPRLVPRKADAFEETVLDFVRKRTGERIIGINETTRDAIADLIAEGFEQGLGPAEVAASIEEATAFNEARAELVARTESMFAYNEAALSSYREFGVSEVTALDGDKDDECAARNGQTFSVDEAFGIADHPNGTLDWAPVVKADPIKAMAVHVAPAPRMNTDEDMVTAMKATLRSLAEPPVVHVDAPDMGPVMAAMRTIVDTISALSERPAPVVNVPPAQITVQPTPVQVVEQKAELPAIVDVRLVEDVRPPSVKKVVRDAQGRVDGVIEGRP
jgi:SPP1 gp7 family putative phage head morphogenesis protein